MPQGKHRYPGIRSFEADDQILFNGRSNEIDELFSLIKIKPLVVLFGKSGLGKTSLLKAGVGPLLLKQHYFPIMIRLQDTRVSPTTSVLNELDDYIDTTLLDKFGGKTKNKIWEAVNAASFKTDDGKPATPVLIFDQFEELFNHPKKVQEEFSNFIGDLIEHRVPADIEGALNKIPRSERTKELMDWFKSSDIKVVFAIRSDRMSELHKMRFEIPAILQNRYELKPLHRLQAKDAVEKPAVLEGKEFLTAPFKFTPDAIEQIQNELSNEFGEIESFQLQIVCQYIERRVKKEQTEGQQNIVVTPEYLGGKDGIKGILKNYYNNQIAQLGTNEEQMAARNLLEEGLIMNKRRISVAEAAVKETYNISDDLLEKLLLSRLIRPEDTRLGRTYEISHDTLVKPILSAFQKRKREEERAEEIKTRMEIQKKQRRARIASILNLLIAIGSVIALVFVYNWYIDAENNKKELGQKNAQLEKTNSELEKTKKELEETREDLNQYLETLASDQLEQIDSTLTILESAEKSGKKMPSINEQRRKLEKTKSDLEKVLQDTGQMRKVAIKEINTNRRQNMIDDLVLAYKGSNEPERKAAVNTVLRSYKNDPTIITEILEIAKTKVDKKYLNNIYQVIYLLERSTPEVLNGNNNSKRVMDYLNTVRASNLVGKRTQSRMDKIEGKLKTSKTIQPEEQKQSPVTDDKSEVNKTKKEINPVTDPDQSDDGRQTKDERQPQDDNQSDDGRQTKKEKKSEGG